MAVMIPSRPAYHDLRVSMPAETRFPARSSRRPRWGLALILADIGALPAAFAVAVVLASAIAPIVSGVALPPAQLANAALRDACLLPIAILYLAKCSHYARRLPFWSALRDLVQVSVGLLATDGCLQFALHHQESRLLLALTWLLFTPAVVAMRAVARRQLDAVGAWSLPVVVIGSGSHAQQAMDALTSEPSLGYQIAGVVSPDHLEAAEGQTWRAVLRRHDAQMLILAIDGASSMTAAMMERLVRERVPFALFPRLSGLPVLGFEQTNFFSHDTVMFSYRNNLAQPLARAIKFSFDLIAAALLLLIASPAFLLIAVAVKLDGGPIFFAHQRVGLGGRRFGCLKFRSMVVDADATLHALLAADPDAAKEWAATQKLRRDPRITHVGRFLRATSLDELPQLLNILRLEMSLVGPRPIVTAEVPRYGEDIAYYYETRPGVTGLWQVSGRSDTGYTQRVQLDKWYVKNWTLWHDVAILAKTVPAVLRRQGAV